MNLDQSKGGVMMENNKQNWRLSIQLTKEQEKELVDMRKRDEYCRLSYGEIVRRLLDAGIEANRGERHGATT